MDGRSRGYTLTELLAVIAVLGIAVGTSALYFRPSAGSLQDSAAQMQGFLSQSRAKAMAITSAVRVRPENDSRLLAETADACSSGSWAADPALKLDLPKTVSLSDTSWSVCFSDRGISNQNLTVTLQKEGGGTRQVEVLLGGTTRVLP